jgi:SAM-dependent methyltransferase
VAVHPVSVAVRLSPLYRAPPTSALPRVCTSVINRLTDALWERRLGITTTGGAASLHPDAHRYGYLAYHTWVSVFDFLGLGPADVVVDLGCGKGRVTCLAAQYPVRKSIGVEIDPPLCGMAIANGQRLRRQRAPVRFVCASATEFDFDAATVITLFHPFGAETMQAVLRRLESSLVRHPRRLRIAYGNPVHGAVLAAKPWLELFETWNPRPWSRVKFPFHFYRARSAEHR